MDIRALVFGLGFLVVMVTCLEGDENEEKRSAELTDNDVMSLSGELDDVLDDKRTYLMRYGKRGPLMRYGKRGTMLMRYGKRGNLLRYGKRADDDTTYGSMGLFRYGKRDDEADFKRLFRWGKRSDVEGDNLADKRSTLMRYGKRDDDVITPEELDYVKRMFRYGKRAGFDSEDLAALPSSWEEAKRTLMRYGRSAQTGAHVPFRFGEKEE